MPKAVGEPPIVPLTIARAAQLLSGLPADQFGYPSLVLVVRAAWPLSGRLAD